MRILEKKPPAGGVVYDQILCTHHKMVLRKNGCSESARNEADTCHYCVPPIMALYGHVVF